MDISGDLRVSSSSSESLIESPNNLLKEILSETGVSRSLLDSAFCLGWRNDNWEGQEGIFQGVDLC